jgi:hypothetical protein
LSLQENATLVAGLVYILAFSLVTSVIFFSPLVLTLSALQSYLLGRPLYSLVLVLLRSMKFCRWDPPKALCMSGSGLLLGGVREPRTLKYKNAEYANI